MKTILDHRGILRRTADDGHPPDLPVGKMRGHGVPFRAPCIGKGVIGDPVRGIVNIGGMEPAVMEHRLGQPFVRHVLQQVAEEGQARIVGNDRALARMARLQIISQGRRIHPIPILARIAQHRQ